MAIQTRPERLEDHDDQYRSRWDGQRMSLEQFLSLPEEKPALEYVEGVVRQKMSPTPDHSTLQVIVVNSMNETAGAQRSGQAFTEVRFVHRSVAFVPDVGYYRRERLQTRPGRRYARDLGPPDIAVEVVSPDQRLARQVQKCLSYLELGATISLLVDPEDEAVLVFRAGQQPRVLRGDDRIDLDDVLPGFALTVANLFASIVPDWLDEPAENAETDAQPSATP